MNRTPLFVGIVLVPLAASCVLGSPVRELRAEDFSRSSQQLLDARAVSDRERRESEHVSLQSGGESDRGAPELHGPIPPSFLSSVQLHAVAPVQVRQPPAPFAAPAAPDQPPALGRAPPAL